MNRKKAVLLLGFFILIPLFQVTVIADGPYALQLVFEDVFGWDPLFAAFIAAVAYLAVILGVWGFAFLTGIGFGAAAWIIANWSWLSLL